MDNGRNYTKEELEFVKELAELGFTNNEILIIVNNDPKTIVDYMNYGNLWGKYEIRKANYTLAKAGSQPAITAHAALLNYADIANKSLYNETSYDTNGQ